MEWKQRDLEFRAYVRKGSWLYERHECKGEYGCIENWEDDNDEKMAFLSKGVFVVQYTGKEDINWKNIFEADICRFENDFGDTLIAVVRYSPDITSFRLFSDKNTSYILGNEYIAETQILGNVFQNPELIEKYKLAVN